MTRSVVTFYNVEWTITGSQYTMDLSALQKMLADDVATGRTPLMVIADAGTPITGHVDNISRIKELCKVHGAWLHLRGHSLAALALPNHQRNGHVSTYILYSSYNSICDSFSHCENKKSDKAVHLF